MKPKNRTKITDFDIKFFLNSNKNRVSTFSSKNPWTKKITYQLKKLEQSYKRYKHQNL